MNGEFDSFYGHEEQADRWCSTCERQADDCTCNPDGDEIAGPRYSPPSATCDSGCLDQGVYVCEHEAPAKPAKLQPGECDVCGITEDRILPDGICMPCSIGWEARRQ